MSLTIRALAVLLALGGVMPALAQSRGATPAPPATEMDLCRRQLAGVHDTADASERQMVLLAEKTRVDQAAAALREAELAAWFKGYFGEADRPAPR